MCPTVSVQWYREEAFWEGPQEEACRLAQKIKKGAAAKPGDLSLILRTHMVQGETDCPLTSTLVL